MLILLMFRWAHNLGDIFTYFTGVTTRKGFPIGLNINE